MGRDQIARTFNVTKADQVITFAPAPTGVTVGAAAGDGHRHQQEPDGCTVDEPDRHPIADAGDML